MLRRIAAARYALAASISAAAALASCATSPTAANAPAAGASAATASTQGTIFISTNLKATLEPCGCSSAMRGGIARAAKIIEDTRATARPVVYLDAADALFPNPTVPEAAVPQYTAKAKAIAASLVDMGLAVRAPGPADAALGDAFRDSLRLPDMPAASFKLLAFGPAKLGVVSAPSLAEAAALGEKARVAGATIVVALVPISMERAVRDAATVAAYPVDLTVVTRLGDGIANDANRFVESPIRIAQLESEGRSFLRVDVAFNGAATALTWDPGEAGRQKDLALLDARIELARAELNDPTASETQKPLRAQQLETLIARRRAIATAPALPRTSGTVATLSFIPIEGSLPEDTTVKAVVADYTRAVGQMNLAWAREHGKSCETPSPGKRGFVGPEACAACHATQMTAWKAQRHHQAYEALVGVQKQYFLDCVGCHVDGWQRAGGVCRIDVTRGRDFVGCESCHGPGSDHVRTPSKSTISLPTRQTCVQCHDPTNSPHFDFDKYITLIKVPGHGLPVGR